MLTTQPARTLKVLSRHTNGVVIRITVRGESSGYFVAREENCVVFVKSNGNIYHVLPETGSCSCKAGQNGLKCKHRDCIPTLEKRGVI